MVCSMTWSCVYLVSNEQESMMVVIELLTKMDNFILWRKIMTANKITALMLWHIWKMYANQKQFYWIHEENYVHIQKRNWTPTSESRSTLQQCSTNRHAGSTRLPIKHLSNTFNTLCSTARDIGRIYWKWRNLCKPEPIVYQLVCRYSWKTLDLTPCMVGHCQTINTQQNQRNAMWANNIISEYGRHHKPPSTTKTLNILSDFRDPDQTTACGLWLQSKNIENCKELMIDFKLKLLEVATRNWGTRKRWWEGSDFPM